MNNEIMIRIFSSHVKRTYPDNDQSTMIPFLDNHPLLQGSQKLKRYAATTNRCFGVNPPKSILGPAWL